MNIDLAIGFILGMIFGLGALGWYVMIREHATGMRFGWYKK